MNPLLKAYLRTIGAIFLLLILIAGVAALAGCGGGGDDEPAVPTPSVDCKAHPELCK